MNRDGNSFRGPIPSHFVDRSPRQNKCCAGTSAKVEHLAPCQDLVFRRAAQYHVQEGLKVLMSRYHARWDQSSKAMPAHCTEELDRAGWKCRNGSTCPSRITSTPQRNGGPAVACWWVGWPLLGSGTTEEGICPPKGTAALTESSWPSSMYRG